MNEWIETTLGNEITLKTGHPFKSNGYTQNKADIKLLRGDNIVQGKLRWENVMRWPIEEIEKYEEYLMDEGDVILAMDRPWIEAGLKQAVIQRDDLPCLQVQRTARLRGGKRLITEYLHYIIASKYFSEYVRLINTGSNVPHISSKQIRDYKVNLPPLRQQKQIASVLSSLDSKIELNNKINAELEAMAKLIYDYWFVQFDFPISAAQATTMGRPELAGKPYKSSGGSMVYNQELKREIPEDWEAFKLGDLGNFKNGVNYDPSNPGEIACPIINVRNISATSYFLKNEDLDTIYLRESDVKKYSVHEGSIIIARSGIPGATRLISDFEENTLYCGFAIHYELEELNQKLPVFFYLKSIEQLIKNGSGGTILKNVNQATLNALQIALPTNEKIIEAFNDIINPQFEKTNLIQKENQELSSLRDWLLPMLMNGQVIIKEAEERVSLAAEPEEAYGGS